jgi:hypothetical protein
MLPPDESWVRIVKPETVVVDRGFLKPLTEKDTDTEALTEVPVATAFETVRTEFAKEHCKVLYRTSRVVQEIAP